MKPARRPQRLHLMAGLLAMTAACVVSPPGDGTHDLNQTMIVPIGEPLHDVRAMHRSPTGSLLVLLGHEPFLLEVGQGDASVTSFGLRKGQGPHELLNPWTLVRIPRLGVTGIVDIGNMKILPVASTSALGDPIRLPPEGVSAVRHDIRSAAFGDPHQAHTVSNLLVMGLYPDGVMNQSDLGRGLLVGYDPWTQQQALIVRLSAYLDAAPPEMRGADLQPIPLWAVCPDGELLVFDPVGERVVRLDIQGQERSSQHVQLARRRLSPVDIERYVALGLLRETGSTLDSARLAELARQVARSARARFPTQAPQVVRLLCDGLGRAWLQLYDSDDNPLGHSRTWMVTGRDGQSSVRVRLPPRLTPFMIEDSVLTGVLTDDTDLQRVVTIRIHALQSPRGRGLGGKADPRTSVTKRR